ncbi:hypothetical protein DCM91_20740 [Chitinophaga costaii]|nr:hypothetical protein DCM91_20740 [Chitinophaga costaii]
MGVSDNKADGIASYVDIGLSMALSARASIPKDATFVVSRPAVQVVKAETQAAKGGANFAEGSFSVFNWKGYPAGGIKPTRPFRLLEGAEYTSARNLANSTNAAMRRANPEMFKGLQIHEIQPVKFGGSPTGLSNKIFLTPSQHAQYNTKMDDAENPADARGIRKLLNIWNKTDTVSGGLAGDDYYPIGPNSKDQRIEVDASRFYRGLKKGFGAHSFDNNYVQEFLKQVQASDNSQYLKEESKKNK